jgi:hypothetical protein
MYASRVRVRLVAGAVVLLFACLGLVVLQARPALANDAFVGDCDYDPTEVFAVNQAVCVTGDMDYTAPGHIITTADILVTANRDWSAGDPAHDVTGSPNRIQSQGGTFYAEYAWLPDLIPGAYDVLIDEDLNGLYNPDHDILLGAGDDAAFTVTATPLDGYTIDVSAIKSGAATQRDHWNSFDKSYLLLENGDNFGTGFTSYVNAAGAGLGLWGKVLASTGTVALGAAGVELDYNAAVVNIGTKVVSSLAGTEAEHFDDLYKDPADPAYGEPAALNVAEINTEIAQSLGDDDISNRYPFQTHGNSPVETHQVALDNDLVVHAAFVRAIQHANERFLGARNAADVRWSVLHADELHSFASTLHTNTEAIDADIATVRADLADQPDGNQVVHAADITSLQDRLRDNGFTTDEQAAYRQLGITDAEAQAWLTEFVAQPAPTSDTSAVGQLDTLQTSVDDYETAVQNLADDASDTATQLQDDQGAVAAPTVDAGAGYSADTGQPVTLSASASGGTGTLSYAWDLDLDGFFDDATGSTVNYTPKAAVPNTLVGVQVTDSKGLSTIDYAPLTVTTANQPPQFTSADPAPGLVTVDDGQAQTFGVTANDPENDDLSYTWELDGQQVSTSPSYTFTANGSSYHTLTVRVADTNAYSHDAVQLWHVSVPST